MTQADVIVIGGGISGLSFAYAMANSGLSVQILESAKRLGGCIDTRHTDDGFWFEMGAHTAYNSYGGLIDMIEGCNLKDTLLQRSKVPFRMLRGGALRSVMKELSLWRVLLSVPRVFGASKDESTVREYYSKLVGAKNYERVLSPFLAAVPSQSADGFPATMLFKKRARRKDIMRSFTLQDGLSSLVEGIAQHPGISVATHTVTSVEGKGKGDDFSVTAADGERFRAPFVALATPPSASASIVQEAHPQLAQELAGIKTVPVESVGVVVASDKLSIEPVAGIVPAKDIFYSAVTRDVVPDPKFRAFTFHFKSGQNIDQRLERIAEVLGVARDDLKEVFEKTATLPAPALGHQTIVAAIDSAVSGTRLAVTGNYFGGLALEDCISRSRSESSRLLAMSA